LLGLLFSMIAGFWLRRILHDNVQTINVTVVTCYLVFYVAENTPLHLSGILALATLGLALSKVGKTLIDKHSEHALHAFWHYAVYICETLIFMATGLFIGNHILLAEDSTILPEDWIKLVIFYPCMLVTRFIVNLILWPGLAKTGYGLTWKEYIVLSYGGLRGSLGLILALVIA